jgi:uracil-DNA glycosylase
VKVLFVGCNPSLKNTRSDVPFEGTRSGVILSEWIRRLSLDVEDVGFINAVERATKSAGEITKSDIDVKHFNFRLFMKSLELYHGQYVAAYLMKAKMQSVSLSKNFLEFDPVEASELSEALEVLQHTPAPKIIALGKIAAAALDSGVMPYFQLPHPSGRNRVLNDKIKITKLLEQAKQFIYEE